MFPSSVYVKSESMTTILTDILESYMESGFKKQFIISHHGESAHNKAILESINNVNEKGAEAFFVAAGFLSNMVRVPDEWNISESILICAKPSEETLDACKRLVEAGWDPHAGERETSLIMRWFPETLRDKENIGGYEPVVQTQDEFRRKARSNWRENYPLGYVGEPHLARREKGEIYVYEARDTANAISKAI